MRPEWGFSNIDVFPVAEKWYKTSQVLNLIIDLLLGFAHNFNRRTHDVLQVFIKRLGGNKGGKLRIEIGVYYLEIVDETQWATLIYNSTITRLIQVGVRVQENTRFYTPFHSIVHVKIYAYTGVEFFFSLDSWKENCY